MSSPSSSDHVDALLDKAIEALRAGDSDKAITLLEKAADISPLREDIQELLSEAFDMELTGEPTKQKSRRPSARKSDPPTDPNPIKTELETYRTPMRMPFSVRWGAMGLALLIVGVTIVCVILFREQIQTRLRTWVDHALVDDPNAEARMKFVKLAESKLQEGYYDDCINFINSRRDNYPELQDQIDDILAEAHFKCGEAYSRRELYQEAMEHYRDATNIKPNRAGYHHSEGWNFYVLARKLTSRMKNYDLFLGRAERSIKKAIELDPENPGYQLDLGRVYSAQGDQSKAVEQYKKVLEIADANTEEGRSAKRLMNMLTK